MRGKRAALLGSGRAPQDELIVASFDAQVTARLLGHDKSRWRLKRKTPGA